MERVLKNKLFQVLSVEKKSESVSVPSRGIFICDIADETPQIRSYLKDETLVVVSVKKEDKVEEKPSILLNNDKKKDKLKKVKVRVGKKKLTSVDKNTTIKIDDTDDIESGGSK